MSDRAEKLIGVREQRTLDEFELRSTGNNQLTFTGYASLFDTPYEMYGGPDKGGWMETVDRGAFTRTLAAKPDVVLLINHEGMPLARTSSGTMTLATDKKGLLPHATLDTRDPDVQRLQVKMERGDLTQMSFAFRTNRQEWSDDESIRSLLELNIDKGDVSVVNNGASPTTSSQIRNLQEALDLLTDLDDERALQEVRALEGDTNAMLTAAYQRLGHLLRATRPVETGRLSVAEAEQIMSGV